MVERPREFEPHTPQQLFALTMFGFVSLSARNVETAHVVLLLVLFFSMLISKQNWLVTLHQIF